MQKFVVMNGSVWILARKVEIAGGFEQVWRFLACGQWIGVTSAMAAIVLMTI